MYLTVKNLGPIKEGKIDLSKKFYVFVGYNNSGKTYMAHLLWTMFNSMTHHSFVARFVLHKLDDFIDIHNSEKGFEMTFELTTELLKNFADMIQHSFFSEILNIENQHLILHDFCINFEIDKDEYHHKIVQKSYHHIPIRHFNNLVDQEDEPFLQQIELELTKEQGSSKIKMRVTTFDDNDYSRELKDLVYSGITDCLEFFMQSLFEKNTPFYMPANRTFYPTFYDYIIGYERHLKKAKDSQSRYTQPMDVLITKMFDLNITTPLSKNYEGLLNYETLLNLLQHVIGGEIVARPRKIEGISPLIEYFLKIDHERELEMYLSSSSVNQLTCLYLFFKHWAQEANNFLIIDEPEENLHPANQLKLLNLLIKFANRNDNKVLITTHSPLLTEAINSHLYLGFLAAHGVDPNAVLQQHGLEGTIDPDAQLTPENTGIYFFDGSTIAPYQIDDYGVLFKDFETVEQNVRKMNETLTTDIYHLLNKEA